VERGAGGRAPPRARYFVVHYVGAAPRSSFFHGHLGFAFKDLASAGERQLQRRAVLQAREEDGSAARHLVEVQDEDLASSVALGM
jgi:hypothetical protein